APQFNRYQAFGTNPVTSIDPAGTTEMPDWASYLLYGAVLAIGVITTAITLGSLAGPLAVGITLAGLALDVASAALETAALATGRTQFDAPLSIAALTLGAAGIITGVGGAVAARIGKAVTAQRNPLHVLYRDKRGAPAIIELTDTDPGSWGGLISPLMEKFKNSGGVEYVYFNSKGKERFAAGALDPGLDSGLQAPKGSPRQGQEVDMNLSGHERIAWAMGLEPMGKSKPSGKFAAGMIMQLIKDRKGATGIQANALSGHYGTHFSKPKLNDGFKWFMAKKGAPLVFHPYELGQRFRKMHQNAAEWLNKVAPEMSPLLSDK
ncbi:hypothetical protein, partial [Streptomyces sp. NPDC001774]